MPTVSSFARLLRILWLGICAGGAAVIVVLGGLAVQSEEPMPEHAELAFYAVALVSVVATAAAFALIRAMESRLLRAGSDAEAQGLIQSFGVAALAAAEVPTIGGAVVAFLTGDLLALAFGVPLFAFAALTWPSDDRVAGWLALHRR